MQKWRDLLNSLGIIGNVSSLLTEDELIEAEARLGFVLPVAYKEFCQVFGCGGFGDFIEIWHPTSDTAAFSSNTIDAMKSSIGLLSTTERKRIDTASIQDLLDSAFIFGGNDTYATLWDLRTYNKIDESYDIYCAFRVDFSGEICLTNRDFFEFVRDFCLGTKSFEILPESMQPSPQDINRTFTPF